MTIPKGKFQQLLSENEQLQYENDMMALELSHMDETLVSNYDFLNWVNEHVLPTYEILYTFMDKQNNISFIICNKASFDKIYNNRFDNVTLYAISASVQPFVVFDSGVIKEECPIPSATFKRYLRDNCIQLEEIRSHDFQKQYYGTALINCVKVIMRQLGLKSITGELGFSDASPNRAHWYEKNGFVVKEDGIGNGTAKYYEE